VIRISNIILRVQKDKQVNIGNVRAMSDSRPEIILES